VKGNGLTTGYSPFLLKKREKEGDSNESSKDEKFSPE
jgi:hypothetical protein